jgi:hypothetical protein
MATGISPSNQRFLARMTQNAETDLQFLERVANEGDPISADLKFVKRSPSGSCRTNTAG